MIPFNKPHITGKEAHYMYQAVSMARYLEMDSLRSYVNIILSINGNLKDVY